MLNFPLPYPDELIYSTIARAGVRLGITSPKMLLDEVFGNRKVIATVDLPNQLSNVVRLLPVMQGYGVEALAYQHTLFPVYAPFTCEDRRKQCLLWMASSSQGAIHLVLGVAASRVKQDRSLRYCPQCLGEQKQQYGEYFWARQWQLAGANCCIKHGQLHSATLLRHGYHRHQFFPASPDLCSHDEIQSAQERDKRVAIQIAWLLTASPSMSANFEQWSCYYKQLALQAGCSRGQQIQYEAIREKVIQYWTGKWLHSQGLPVTESQSCWLRGIFRKHRKSFSYLEHIVALAPFLSAEWRITDVIEQVKTTQGLTEQSKRLPIDSGAITETTLSKRKDWQLLVLEHGPKTARNQNSALYAWLYRNDKEWLLNLNRQCRVERSLRELKVDWHKRDRETVRKLAVIRDQFEFLLDSPRWSKNWYLSQLEKSAAVAKNPEKFPLVQCFFQRYCEDTTDYQVRRITCTLTEYQYPAHRPERWQLLRSSGLSDERITALTEQFMQEVLKYHAGNTV